MATSKRRGDNRILPDKSNPGQHQDSQLTNPQIQVSDIRITQQIIRILVDKHNPQDVKDLMQAENVVFRERLEIIREHAEHHPDAKEERATIKFRRSQYGWLSFIGPALLVAIPFVTIEVAAIFGIIAIMIIGAIILNARDRDFDINSLTDMINTIIRRGK